MLAFAHKAHAEAFLKYKTMDPKRTDGVARAMADQDIDLTRAEVAWEVAQRELDIVAQEFELARIKLLIGGTDAAEPTTRPDQAGEGEADLRTYGTLVRNSRT